MRSRTKISLMRMPIILEAPDILVMEIPERETRKQLVFVDRLEFESADPFSQVVVKEIPLFKLHNLHILS